MISLKIYLTFGIIISIITFMQDSVSSSVVVIVFDAHSDRPVVISNLLFNEFLPQYLGVPISKPIYEGSFLFLFFILNSMP